MCSRNCHKRGGGADRSDPQLLLLLHIKDDTVKSREKPSAGSIKWGVNCLKLSHCKNSRQRWTTPLQTNVETWNQIEQSLLESRRTSIYQAFESAKIATRTNYIICRRRRCCTLFLKICCMAPRLIFRRHAAMAAAFGGKLWRHVWS